METASLKSRETPLEYVRRKIIAALRVPTWSPRRNEIAYFGLVEVEDTNQPSPNPYHIYSMNLNDGIGHRVNIWWCRR